MERTREQKTSDLQFIIYNHYKHGDNGPNGYEWDVFAEELMLYIENDFQWDPKKLQQLHEEQDARNQHRYCGHVSEYPGGVVIRLIRSRCPKCFKENQ
jgi:hypothetical protein